MEHLPELGGVRVDLRQPLSGDEADGVTCIVVKLQDGFHELVEVQRDKGCGGHARVLPEVVDHLPERVDLLDDGVGRPLEKLQVLFLGQLGVKLPGQPFGGKPDGRERILDLVRKAAGDLAPGGGSLRLHEGGHVVEDEHGPRLGAELHGRSFQVERNRHAVLFKLEVEGFGGRADALPVLIFLEGRNEFGQRIAKGGARHHVLLAHDAACRLIGRDDRVPVVHDHDARRNVAEHALQKRLGLLGLQALQLEAASGFGHFLDHRVEGAGQHVDFVAALELADRHEVARGHASGAFGKLHDGRRRPACKGQRSENAREDGEQDDERERQRVKRGHGALAVGQLLVLAVACDERGRMKPDRLVDGLGQLQEELLAAGGLGKQSRGLEVGEGRSVQRRNGDDDAYA